MAELGTDLGHVVALLLGSLCVLLGFVLVARGVGTTDSESSLRIAGVEFKLSKVGPGILFSLIGVLLVYLGIQTVERPGNTIARTDPAPVQPTNQMTPVTDDGEPGEAPANSVMPAIPQPVTQPPSAPPAEDPIVRQHRAEADALRRGLAAITAGQCPDDLFGPAVLSACVMQIAYVPANLAGRGPVQSIDYEGPYSPGSSLNIYRVRYPNSEMRWAVQVGGDGKLVTMASPG